MHLELETLNIGRNPGENTWNQTGLQEFCTRESELHGKTPKELLAAMHLFLRSLLVTGFVSDFHDLSLSGVRFSRQRNIELVAGQQWYQTSTGSRKRVN